MEKPNRQQHIYSGTITTGPVSYWSVKKNLCVISFEGEGSRGSLATEIDVLDFFYCFFFYYKMTLITLKAAENTGITDSLSGHVMSDKVTWF